MNERYSVKTETIIRTVILVLALINQVLTSLGKPVIPVSDEELTEALTLTITIVVSIWSWWKNNSFTQAALEADEVMRRLKEADE